MVLTRFAILAFVSSAAWSCAAVQSFGDKKDENKDEGGASTPAETPTETAAIECQPSAPDCEKADQPLDETTQFGLADFCTFAKNDKGEGCFTCTPRDLPDTRCSAIPADFDATKACTHDLDEMSCELGEKDFVYDFNEESKDEKLYNKIPLLLIGAKALLADKLKDKPEVKELVYGALDIVNNYKKDIFTNADLGPMVDELAAVVKKAKPEYDQAKIDEFKAQAKPIIKAMQDKRAAGKLDTASMLTTFTDVLNQLPPDLVAPLLENLDIAKITAALSGAGGDDSIQALIALFGNGKSIEDIIAGLESTDSDPATP